jgi:hypothetical protein
MIHQFSKKLNVQNIFTSNIYEGIKPDRDENDDDDDIFITYDDYNHEYLKRIIFLKNRYAMI